MLSDIGPNIILGLYRGYIGLYRGYIGVILGLYWDNGKENGNYDYSSAVCATPCSAGNFRGHLPSLVPWPGEKTGETLA